MVIRRKINKELKIILFYIIIFIGIFLFPYENISVKIGLAFIFGIPIFLAVMGFFRSFRKLLVICEINENELILNYFNNRKLSIPIKYVKEIGIKIHSQKTAIISINLYEYSSSIVSLDIHKNLWNNFVEFGKYLSIIFNENGRFKVYKMNDRLGKECCEFFESCDWYEFLTKKKNVNDVLKEIIGEGIIKKILVIVGSILVVFFKSSKDVSDYNILICTAVIMFVLYLIICFYLRMIGYSRSESIEIFFTGLFCLIFGFGAVYEIVMWIAKFKVI